MKKIRDRFSNQSKLYSAYRPLYPPALYQRILQRTENRRAYWDCATGNGQVVRELAPHFEKAVATDISENQLRQAPDLPNVEYRCLRAEETPFKDNTFDLITVGQAIHWFDIEAFLRESARVARNGATMAVWGYGLLKFDDAADEIIDHFYRQVVGPWWDGERKHIDTGYASIPFDLVTAEDLGGLSIERPMDLDALLGYLNSWSSVQNYRRAKEVNPVDVLAKTLRAHWPAGTTKTAVFPLFGTLGKIEK